LIVARILVVANETIGGKNLIEAVRKRAEAGDAEFVLCVPRTNPRDGNIIYDDFVYQAAQVRVDLARKWMREQMGIEVVGEVGDPDPYTAAMDAVREYSPDEIIVSTKPATVSGWLRRDLVDRLADASRLPVEHVVSDIDSEGLPFDVVLVLANRTASSDQLLEHLRAKNAEGAKTHLFIVVIPLEGGQGIHVNRARAQLAQYLDRARAAGLLTAGMVADPDPFTAARNATQMFRVDEIVVSTLGPARSGWLRADLVERIRKSSDAPVEHVVASDRETATA
jgi:hypothetical protein